MFKDLVSISVVIPYFNAHETIERTIKSVLNQSEFLNQIIIVNDGSSDESFIFLEKIISKFSGSINLINQKNKGVSSARNKGIELCNTKWICFLDSDDEWYPDFIKNFKFQISKNKSIDVYSSSLVKVKNNKILKKYIFEDKLFSSKQAVNELLQARGITGMTQNKIYKHSLLHHIRFEKDIKINEDIIFNLDVFNNSKFIYSSSTLGFKYHMMDDSVMHSFSKEKVITIINASKLIKKRCENFGVDNHNYIQYYLLHVVLGIFKLGTMSFSGFFVSLKQINKHCKYLKFKNIYSTNLPFKKKILITLIYIINESKNTLLRYKRY